MNARSGLDPVVPAVEGVERLEQTASTAPSQLPEVLERATPKTQTTATSGPSAALSIARVLIVGVVFSALSASPQPIALPSWRRREVVASVESIPAEINPVLVEQMRQIFEKGASEFFEDGMDSAFAQELLLSVMEYGNAAIDAIAEYVFSSTANPDVGSEALRRLGEVQDRRILASRWGLMQRALRHRSSQVRDGAVLGFASLDDRRALEILKSVEMEEAVPELRRLIQKVIEQLGAAHGEAAAQG